MSGQPSYDARAQWFWKTILEGGIEARPLLVRDDLTKREHVVSLRIDRSKPLHRSLEKLLEGESTVMQTLLVWSTLWSECGFPQLVVGHKTAASFMATTMARDAVRAEVRLPWKAFLIQVPPGLLEFPDRAEWALAGREPIVRAHVVQWNKGDLSVLMSSPLGIVAMHRYDGLEDLGDDEEDDGPIFGAAIKDVERRAFQLVGRLVVGCCLGMSSPEALRASASHAARTRHAASSSEPSIWTYTLRRDVKIDIREQVRAYARGERETTPSVKVLVRGHWKRQRHGPDHAETKVIHLEPYWRGPEDVPIAVRKHVLD